MSFLDETKFIKLIREYGLCRLIFSFDFIISFGVTLLLLLDKIYWGNAILSNPEPYILTVIAAAGSLFAITLTAIAIIFSFSSSRFVKFLGTSDSLRNILLQFWLGSIAYIFSILIALIHSIRIYGIGSYSYPFAIGAFVYGLISSLYILATIVRFGFFIYKFETDVKE